MMASKKNSTLKNVLLVGAIGIGGLAILGAVKGGGNTIPIPTSSSDDMSTSQIPSIWDKVNLVKKNNALAREYTNATLDLMSAQTGGLTDYLKFIPGFALIDALIYDAAQRGIKDGSLKPDAKDDDSRDESGQETTPNPTPNPMDKINLVYTNPGKETASALGVRYYGGASSMLQNIPGLSSNPLLKKAIANLQDAEVLSDALTQGQLIPATEELKKVIITNGKSGSTSKAAAIASMAKRTLNTSKT